MDSTLVNGSALGGSGPSRTVGTYWPKYVVETNSVVPQWKSSDSILMSEMSMSFDNLNSWMNPIPIRSSRPGSRSVTQLLKRPNESAYCVDDEGTMLKFSARYSSLTDQDNPSVPTGTLTTIPLLVVSPTAPKKIDWFRTYFKKLQHMLVVLMGEATNINHAEGVVEIGDSRRPFLIYWKQSINVKRDTPIAPQNMLVRYSDFRRRKIKVTSWLANYDEIEEQIALIVETILSPGMYREFKWLMLTQAIESFHRKTIGGSHMDKEEYLDTVAQEIKSSIPRSLPRDHRDSL